MGYQESLITLNEASIKDLIYIIRGQRVMLNFDLACIYGYETKRFNEQIRNNIAKFDDDFMFRLTLQEWDSVLRSKKSTANNLAKRRCPPVINDRGLHGFAGRADIYSLKKSIFLKPAVKKRPKALRLASQMICLSLYNFA